MLYLWAQIKLNLCAYRKTDDRDGSVGIAILYGLEGPEIESRWGARYFAPVLTGAGAHAVFYMMGTESFPGVKRPGRDVDHVLPSNVEVKERIELFVYSHFGLSRIVLG